MDTDAAQSDKDHLYETLDATSEVEAYKNAYMQNMEIASASEDWEAYIVVPQDQENLSQFLYFSNRITGEEYTLDDSGVIISEKTASMLDVKAGDTIRIKEDEFSSVDVQISAICENYVGHYIYMTPALYESVFESLWNIMLFLYGSQEIQKMPRRRSARSFSMKMPLSVYLIWTVLKTL